MDDFAALDAARAEFDRRLRLVGAGAWETGTPCEGWTVRALVDHILRGNVMAARLIDGATKEESLAPLDEPLATQVTDDPVGAFAATADMQAAAFRIPGALERTVHHPALDMPGAQLLGFRIGDLALHAWDLSRALGLDEQLDDALVAHVWEGLQPMAPFIGQVGVFGTGPSGTVPDDAPLQTRLLDLTGRRP